MAAPLHTLPVEWQLPQLAVSTALPPTLLLALVEVESRGNPWAIRYEPSYRWLWDLHHKAPFQGQGAYADPTRFPSLLPCSPATEWAAQKTSWGLLQVMGAVARERGFRGPFLSALCEPWVGLELGCRQLTWLRGQTGGDLQAMVAAYNGGLRGNAGGTPREALRTLGYVRKVEAELTRWGEVPPWPVPAVGESV